MSRKQTGQKLKLPLILLVAQDEQQKYYEGSGILKKKLKKGICSIQTEFVPNR